MATDVEHWRQTIEDRTTRAPSAVPARIIWLETASAIWATPGITLNATQLAPTNNWARFHWYSTANFVGTHKVRFEFLWQNTSDHSVAIRATGYLILHGNCRAQANGGPWPPDDRWCNMYVGGRLDINEHWGQPSSQPGQVTDALWLETFSRGVFGGTDVKHEFLNNRGLIVEYDQYVLPPQGSARIYVSCQLYANIRDGSANFKFRHTADPAWQVLAYAVVLNVQP
jgi:hypothetical protein